MSPKQSTRILRIFSHNLPLRQRHLEIRIRAVPAFSKASGFDHILLSLALQKKVASQATSPCCLSRLNLIAAASICWPAATSDLANPRQQDDGHDHSASGIHKTPFGTIEFTHTKRSRSQILGRTLAPKGRPLRIATRTAALRDLSRVGRNANMVIEDESDMAQ